MVVELLAILLPAGSRPHVPSYINNVQATIVRTSCYYQ